MFKTQIHYWVWAKFILYHICMHNCQRTERQPAMCRSAQAPLGTLTQSPTPGYKWTYFLKILFAYKLNLSARKRQLALNYCCDVIFGHSQFSGKTLPNKSIRRIYLLCKLCMYLFDQLCSQITYKRDLLLISFS